MDIQVVMCVLLVMLKGAFTQQNLQCFSCLDLRTIESDGTGSGQPDIRSAVIGALFEGSAPPSCDGHGLVNCTGVNHRCMTARTITEGVYMGVTGSVEVLLAACVDVTHPGFTFPPDNTSPIPIDDAIDWEKIINVRLTRNTGLAFGCSWDNCNHPSQHSGLHCYSCLDFERLGKPEESRASALVDSLEEAFFTPRGIKAVSCSNPLLVQCPNEGQQTCSMLRIRVTASYHGSSGVVDVHLGYCIDLTQPRYANRPENGCTDELMADTSTLLDGSLVMDDYSGEICSCNEYGCNRPEAYTGLQCFSCLDVDIIRSDERPSSISASLYDRMVKRHFGGVNPASCDNPAMLKCTSGNVCVNSRNRVKTSDGNYHEEVIEYSMSYCADPSERVYARLEDGCGQTQDVLDLGELGLMWGSRLSDIRGLTCGCQQYACNHPKHLTGSHCFSCMDLAVIGMTGSLPDDVSLRDVVAQSMFGTDPGSCHNPVLTRCADDQACFSGNMYSEGHKNGFQVELAVKFARCIDKSSSLLEYMPDNTCVAPKLIVKRDQLGKDVDANITMIEGESCGCDTFSCNHPKDLSPVLCYSCLHINNDTSTAKNTIVDRLFLGEAPPSCKQPAIVTCGDNHHCVSAMMTFNDEDNADLTAMFATCASNDMDVYRNLPSNGCDVIENTLDLPIGGVRSGYMGGISGVLCACNSQTACNHPDNISGMYCHKCLDLEADKTSEIRVAPLELSVVRSLYNGAHPGSCHERNLQKCHDPDSVCAMSDVIFTGSYAGGEGEVRMRDADCLPKTQVTSQPGCQPWKDVHDQTKYAEIFNTEFTETDGRTCHCTKDGCNKARGMDDLKCYQCADVGELTAEQLTALDAIFPGLSDLPPCDQPDIVTCSVYNKCYHADWKLLGKIGGDTTWMNVSWSRCADPDTDATLMMPSDSCQHVTSTDMNKMGFLEDADLTLDEGSGDVCVCHTNWCNDPQESMGVLCHQCVDITSDLPEQAAAFLRETWGDRNPPSCSSPQLVRCPTGDMCFSAKVHRKGAFSGKIGEMTYVMGRCMPPPSIYIPWNQRERRCSPARDLIVRTANDEMNQDIVDVVDGTICTCGDKDGCNDPRDFQDRQCYYCFDMDVTLLDGSDVSPELRSLVFDTFFKGVVPPSCQNPELISCPSNNVCTVGHGTGDITVSGQSLHISDVSSACLLSPDSSLSDTHFELTCERSDVDKVNDAYNALGFDDVTVEAVSGVECMCNDVDGCNNPKDFIGETECVDCYDISIDGDVSPADVRNSYSDAMKQHLWGDHIPALCNNPDTVTCPRHKRCVSSKQIIKSEFEGYSLRSVMRRSECVEPWDVSGLSISDANTCATRVNNEAVHRQLTEAGLGNVTSEEAVVCRCEHSMCNQPSLAESNLCYHCIDVESSIPGMTRTISNKFRPTYAQAPFPACTSPSIVACPSHQNCETTERGIIGKHHGIDGQVTFYQHTCHNRPHPLSTVHPLKGNPNVRCGSGTEISSIPWRGSTVNMFVGSFTSDGCFGSENKPGPGDRDYLACIYCMDTSAQSTNDFSTGHDFTSALRERIRNDLLEGESPPSCNSPMITKCDGYCALTNMNVKGEGFGSKITLAYCAPRRSAPFTRNNKCVDVADTHGSMIRDVAMKQELTLESIDGSYCQCDNKPICNSPTQAVFPTCYKCLDISSDTEGSMSTAHDMRKFLFGEEEMDSCKFPTTVTCGLEEMCYFEDTTTTMLSDGVSHKIKMRRSGCLPDESRQKMNIQLHKCREADVDLGVWRYKASGLGRVQNMEGVLCTCKGDQCNTPQLSEMVFCKHCMDVRQFGKYQMVTLAEAFFGDDPTENRTPLSCNSNVLSPCPDDRTCYYGDVTVNATYKGVTEESSVVWAKCTSTATKMIPPPGQCVRAEQIDVSALEEEYQATAHNVNGILCSCNDTNGCNIPPNNPGLQCETCLDVRGDSQLTRIKEMLRNDLHRGYYAPSCDNAHLRTCAQGQRCVVGGLNIAGSYRASHGYVYIESRRCADRIPELLSDNQCVDSPSQLRSIYPLNDYGIDVEEVQGKYCTCDHDACNTQQKIQTVDCYECLEISGVEDYLVQELTDMMAQTLLGRDSVNSCTDPEKITCPSGNMCYMERSTTDIMYKGESISVTLTWATCGDKNKHYQASYPTEHAECHQVSLNDVSQARVNITGAMATEFNGVSCSCNGDVCHNPEDLYGTMCHHCIDALTDVPEAIDPLLSVLNKGRMAPSCAKPGITPCPPSHECINGNGHIWGNYNGKSGFLAFGESRCVDTTIPPYAQYPKSRCIRLENLVQTALFGWVTSDDVSAVTGSICKCDTDYCNTPPAHVGLKCSHCLDVPEQSDFSRLLKQGLVDHFFNETSVPTCDNSEYKTCRHEDRMACLLVESKVTGSIGGVSGSADVSLYTCMSRSSSIINIVEDRCYHVRDALDIPAIAATLGVRLDPFGGNDGHACACDSFGCNLPQVALECHECYDVTVHDGSSDVTRAVEDMLRRDVFRGPLQENCETAAATRCQRGSVCQVDHASYTASHNGDTTRIDVDWARCQNRDLNGQRWIKPNEFICDHHDQTDISSVDIAGVDIHGMTGANCWCTEERCNKPTRLLCNKCIDMKTSLLDDTVREDLLKSASEGLFGNTAVIPPCSTPDIEMCDQDQVCAITRGKMNGQYAEVDGYINFTMVRCAGDDDSWLGFVPDNGCTPAEDTIRLDQLIRRTTAVSGDLCACDDHMCNTEDRLTEPTCFECITLKTTSAEDETPEIKESVKRVLEAMDMPSCVEPTQRRCPSGSQCGFARFTVTVSLSQGRSVDIDVTMATCVTVNYEMKDWFTGIKDCNYKTGDVELSRQGGNWDSNITGVFCGCHRDHCNVPDTVPLECHECMDVDVDLDDSISYKATQDIIRSVRGSQSLQNCDHPHITVCEQHDKCATSDITYTGVFNDVRGEVRANSMQCSSRLKPYYKHPLIDTCVPAKYIQDTSMPLNSLGDLTDTDGDICVCSTSLCNTLQRGIYVSRECSVCKNVKADFGRTSINKEVEITALTSLFEDNTHWCSCPGSVRCSQGGRCTTIKATVSGNTGSSSGYLSFDDHRCMSSVKVEGLKQHGVNNSKLCWALTEDILNYIYEAAVDTMFDLVKTTRGTLCFCDTDLCNLPEREDEPEEKKSSSGSIPLVSMITMTTTYLLGVTLKALN